MSAPLTFSPVPGIHSETLANGIRLLVFESHSAPHVSFRLMKPVGGLNDPNGFSGLASLTATLMRHGAGNRDEQALSEALDGMAARLSTTSARERAEVSADTTTLRPDNLPRLLDMVADVVRKPRFDLGEHEKVVARRRAQLQRVVDSHGSMCSRAFEMTTFEGHPYGRPSSGTLDSLGALTLDAVADFHASHWGPDGVIIGFAGDIAPETARAIVEERFGDWASRPVPEPVVPVPVQPSGRRVTVVEIDDPSLSQVHFRIGHPLQITLESADYHAYRTAVQLFGGDFTARLNQRLRVQEGLTYGARYDYRVGGKRSGSAAVATYAPKKDFVRAIELALTELDQLRATPIPSQEIEAAQRKLVHSFPFRFETPGGSLEQHLWAVREGVGVGFLQAYQQTIAAVTSDQATAAAEAHVSADDVHIVLVGDAAVAETAAALAATGAVQRKRPADFGVLV